MSSGFGKSHKKDEKAAFQGLVSTISAMPGLCLSLLLSLSACQNDDIMAQKSSADSRTDRHPDQAAPSHAISISIDDGPWLGGHAVPLGTNPQPISADAEPAPLSQDWRVKSGESVAGTIRRWAAAAGYTPLPKFSATEDWSFIVTEDFSGSFEEALAWLSAGFDRQPIKPVVVLFANRTLDLVAKATGQGTRPEPGAL